MILNVIFILLHLLSGQFFKYLNINKNPSGKLLNQDKVKIIEECIDSALFSIVSSIGNVCKGANEQDFIFITRGLFEKFFVSPSKIPPCFNIKCPNKNVITESILKTI